jgi:hypothetical protein
LFRRGGAKSALQLFGVELCSFLARNFPCASAVVGKFEGSRVRSASPESRDGPRSAMSDQILLQFEAIRMIAASLVAVAITIA